MSSHRVHSIFSAQFEVDAIERRKGYTTLEMAGVNVPEGGPFREIADNETAASMLLDITSPPAQAMIELLQPGQKLKVYFELEHPYAHDSLQIEQEPPPVLYMKDFMPPLSTLSSGTALQNTGQYITVNA